MDEQQWILIPTSHNNTLRRTKAILIYYRSRNLCAVQLLLGHTRLESAVGYLGIEVDVALEMAEQTEVLIYLLPVGDSHWSLTDQ